MAEPRFSAGLEHADPLRLGGALHSLREAGLHSAMIRIADGRFVPEYSGGIELVRRAADCGLPIDVHLACAEPHRAVEALAESGCRTVFVHCEADRHAHRTLHRARDLGMKAGIAINPATSLTRLTYILPHVDAVLVVASEPGGRYIPSAPERVNIMRENIRYHEYAIEIHAAGGLGAESAARCHRGGAEVCCLGEPLFGAGTIAECYARFLSAFDEQLHLV